MLNIFMLIFKLSDDVATDTSTRYNQLLSLVKPSKGALGAALKRRKLDDKRELASNALDGNSAGSSDGDGDGDDDSNSGDTEKMLELTAEELEAKRAELGDDFELVAADGEEDGAAEDDDSEDSEEVEDEVEDDDDDADDDEDDDRVAAEASTVPGDGDGDSDGDSDGDEDGKAGTIGTLYTARYHPALAEDDAVYSALEGAVEQVRDRNKRSTGAGASAKAGVDAAVKMRSPVFGTATYKGRALGPAVLYNLL